MSHDTKTGRQVRIPGTDDRRAPAKPHVIALRRAIGQLRHCIAVPRPHYGDTPDVRPLANDPARLDIDAAHSAGRPTPPKQRDGQGGKPDIVVVPGTPYDPALWLGADDEGVGGVRG